MGIRTKFISLVSAVVVVLLTVMTVIIISTVTTHQSQQADGFVDVLKTEQGRQETLLREALLQKGDSLASSLSLTAAGLIANFDYDGLTKAAVNIEADKDVVSVAFFDEDGKRLGSDESEETEATTAKTGEGTELITKKILSDGEPAGRTELVLSFASVEESMTNITARIETTVQEIRAENANAAWAVGEITIICAAAAVMALCLAIYLAVSRIITLRLGKTVGVLEKVAEGDLSQRLEFDSQDELGRLAAALNTAVESSSNTLEQVREAAEREKQAQAEHVREESRRREEQEQRRAEEDQRKRQAGGA